MTGPGGFRVHKGTHSMARTKKLRCNEDLVADLMASSPRGPLSQAFIVTAIEQYCDRIIAAGAAACHNGLIDGAAWVEIATDTKTRMDAFYGRHAAAQGTH